MKWRPSILAAFAAVIAASIPSGAYDSSGGAKIAGLLARVEFASGGDPEFDPPLFEWTEPKRREVLDALAGVLARMPVDLADLPEISRLSISNGRCSAAPDPEDLASGPEETRKARYLDSCASDTATYFPKDRSVAISGTIYELSRGPSVEGRKLLARVLQHELTHAWEKASETKPFYALAFEKRDKEWFQVLSRNEEIYEKEEELAENAGESRRARLTALRTALRESQHAVFQTMGLPSRFGGFTGRVDPRAAAGEDPIDTDSMRTRHEYLAVLSELLWVDPALALSQYSPDEVSWVESHAFKGRPVVAFAGGK